MPANLTPQYFEAEKKYREARTAPEKIAALEEMIAMMPKHKGTDHLKADLRRKIARLTQSADKKSATARASMIVIKEGAAQVIVVGPPNSGKSQLITSLTNATPQVGDFPFTTQLMVPGMMEFENIQIQLVDSPPLVSGAVHPLLPPNLIRADGLFIVTDLSGDPLEQAADTIDELKKQRIIIGSDDTAKEKEYGVYPKPALLVANKIDLPGADVALTDLREFYGEMLPVIAISAMHGTGLEDLRNNVFRMLEIIRVYTKTPGQKADMNDPLILPAGSTLEEAAKEVHKDFNAKLKFARIWGSGKHDGVMVKRDHVLRDGDIIELHM